MVKYIRRKVIKDYSVSNAHQRMDDHEKLCRIMAKETNGKISDIKLRVARIEKLIIGSGATIITGMAYIILRLV